MIIAVTYENEQIFQHFGHTTQFKVYETEGNEIISSKVIDTNGQGHGALAGLLKIIGADVLICGGIGGGAQIALAEAEIKLCGGVKGSCDAAVEAFLANNLGYDPDVKCDHHDREHAKGEHNCGEHSCGTHNCGGHSFH